MKKGGKHKDFFETRYFQLFRRTFIKKSVSDQVNKYRDEYSVPIHGFPTMQERLKYEKAAGIVAKHQLVWLATNIARKYKLPDNPWLLEDFILCGGFYDAYKFGPIMNKGLCRIVDPVEKPLSLRYGHQRDNFSKCARIEISPYATKDDIKDFLNETNWNKIKSINSKHVKDAYEGISGSPDTERNEDIFEMSLSSKPELLAYLQEHYPPDKTRGYFRKEDVISHLIEHIYGVKLGTENIRRIIRIERKLREE